MNFKMRTAAAAILAASLVASYGFADDAKPVAKKTVATKKAKTPPAPTVEEQIEKLRTELEGQINGLKSNLADKDAQLKQAQQTAADAQAAAAKAQQAVDAQQQADTTNAAAVTILQSTVNDLKGNQVSLATTVSDETAKLKKDIANPTALHYKGVTITPGGYFAGEAVYRSKATGGGIPAAWSSLPYEKSGNYQLSEFFGGGNATRLNALVEGKTSWGTLRGFVEGDFLGVGAGSNNNQSNSYDFRMRVAYGEAQTNSGWTVAAGQLWSLATEGKKGISSSVGNNNGPSGIDPNNTVGFIWTRQFGARLVKNFNHAAFGISVENPQLIYSATLAGNTPNAVIGSVGASGGNYNSTISSVSATTYIQNYTNAATIVNGVTVNTPLPVYNVILANANVANYSFNEAPDVLVKAAFDPGFGHYEVFGIVGFAHETVYPNITIDRLKFGGLTDVINTANADPLGSLAYAKASTVGAHSNAIIVGGFGASARVPVIKDKLSIGAKGLYGPGVGRYAQSTLTDVTANSWGGITPIHNLAGLLTVEATPTPRLALYANYGGEYASRADFGSASASTLGSPTAAELTPGTATTAGSKWGATWAAAAANKPVGYGSRLTDNSGCLALSNPGGVGGSSTGYYPGGSCSAQTRNVQEVTAGYWYDLYKGDRGRLRQGVQYEYGVREGWSGLNGIGAKGIDNMVLTSLRYYLP